MRKIVAAIVGNPRSGKTTVFNAVTGSGRHDGDHCGADTAGMVEQNGVQVQFIDLPGTHTLMATTWREILTCNFLRLEKPDVVVHVIDASRLARSLYLSSLLMELGLRLVIRQFWMPRVSTVFRKGVHLMDSFTEDMMARSATESQRLYLCSLRSEFPENITVSQAFKAIDKIEEDDIAKSRVEIREDGSVDVVSLEPEKPGNVNVYAMILLALATMLLFIFVLSKKLHIGIWDIF